MRIYKMILPSVALMSAALASCSHGNEWELSGVVNGAENGTELILETSDNGRWYGIDTLKTDASGRFSILQKAPQRPTVYRLRLNDRFIYFPIDSIDKLTLTTKFSAFDEAFDLEGSSEADMMESIDKSIIVAGQKKGIEQMLADSLLKRELGRKVLANPSGITAYYIVNKRVGGRPIFNPNASFDRKIIGAVATAYGEKHPTDPRTTYLRELYLSGRQATVRTVEAPETPMFDIRLFDRTGTEQSLTEVAAKNKVVVLNFTTHSAGAAPALNSLLNKVREQYHSSGMEIYQVSVGDDERHWIEVSKNLPWISVYQSEAGDATPLLNYNVNQLPATYVIVNGEIRERVTEIGSLGTVVQKYI